MPRGGYLDLHEKKMNKEVTEFLDKLDHPFRKEIEELRAMILESYPGMEEDIKWNGPNYKVNGGDRVSIKVNPPVSFHLILHRGAKVLEEPREKLLKEDHGLLNWKANDRAVATFKDSSSFNKARGHIKAIVENWLRQTT